MGTLDDHLFKTTMFVALAFSSPIEETARLGQPLGHWLFLELR